MFTLLDMQNNIIFHPRHKCTRLICLELQFTCLLHSESLKKYSIFWHIVKMSEAACKLDAMQRPRIILVVCYQHHIYMKICFGYRVHVSCMYTRADADPGPESTYINVQRPPRPVFELPLQVVQHAHKTPCN
jgi:hypothetical protein